MNGGLSERIPAQSAEPESLELLYRTDPASFAAALSKAIEAEPESVLLRAWRARLEPVEKPAAKEASEGSRATLWLVIFLCAVAGLIAKLPAFFPSILPDEFYPRNLGFAVLGPLGAYSSPARRRAGAVFFSSPAPSCPRPSSSTPIPA